MGIRTSQTYRYKIQLHKKFIDDIVKVIYVPSEIQKADILMKALVQTKFEKLRSLVRLKNVKIILYIRRINSS